MRVLVALAMSMSLFASALLASAGESGPPIVKANTRAAFESAAADVRKEMESGGRYAFVKPDERDKVEAGLGDMYKLFEKDDSVEHMTGDDKIALFNAQESVNSILTSRDRDRLICERGTLTGSRIVSTSCHTYGELEAARQASQKLMQEKLSAPCTSKACGGQ